MIDSAALLKDLRAQLRLLQADLTERAEDPQIEWSTRLQAEYAEAVERQRTGLSWLAWRDNQVDQAAVAWLVSTTFLRFCEDNALLAGARVAGRQVPVGWITGPGEGTQRAEENLDAYIRSDAEHRSHSRRHWLQQGFAVLAAQPAGAALIDRRHNPVWSATISGEAAAALMAFWRRTTPDGDLVHDFTDASLDTRFLGDLYQDLSEHAKKTYALLQTPEFVEEFILDQTLEPAVREFGLKGLRVIDPTCGSGHFLLGAFERLHAKWLADAPAMGARERVRTAMASISGVDLNPFAVAIARFRLTVAGMRAAGDTSLAGLAPMGFRLAIGESLLGAQGTQDTFDDAMFGQLNLGDTLAADDGATGVFEYATEDLGDYRGILTTGQYHVVVGNPPYITVKDSTLNRKYRKAYPTAHRQYALSVPFMELFFRLAIRGAQGVPAGYVGQITANSFMKREFGKKLIEQFFGGRSSEPSLLANPADLTHVIDTSGAYIPGHGTPTVIIVGRRRWPEAGIVRAVLGVRGEPGQPDNPAKGKVWTEIVQHLAEPGFDGTYVSVTDLDREVLTSHPWSLSGGGADQVLDLLNAVNGRLSRHVDEIGFGAVTREDDAFMVGVGTLRRQDVPEAHQRALVEGEYLRDFTEPTEATVSAWPYDTETLKAADDPSIQRMLWPWKHRLVGRVAYGKTQLERKLHWFEYSMFFDKRYRRPLSIAFPFVSTHNHFVLDRGGKVFKQTAPVIKLPEGASEDDHLELLGVLNSSAACFWLKQVSHDKGNGGIGGGIADQEWERFFEFTGTKLQEFPLPPGLTPDRGRVLDSLARDLQATSPRAVVERWVADPGGRALTDALAEAEQSTARLRARMVYEQEELDWHVYHLYGLIDEPLTDSRSGVDSLDLGERAFEIALARRVAAGDEDTAWFARHGSDPITEIPAQWPATYRDLVQRRLDLMADDRSIRLLERPEFKRRWLREPWAKQQRAAVRDALLDRLEDPALWRDAQGVVVRSLTDLAHALRHDQVVAGLAVVLSGTGNPDLADVLAVALDEAVPYLAAHRYKPQGLEKFRTWQQTWDLQRCEDAGEEVTIPVPPRYATADFRRPEYWRARGKLDVPKERFIAYPDLRRQNDPTPVLGWAGWDHRDQALALARELPALQADGDTDALTAVLAGLVELEPWLHQWHHEIEPQFGVSPAQMITQVLDTTLSALATTREQVTADVQPPPTRARRK